MSCAIIIHGAIGSGKTCSCLRLSKRAVKEGIKVAGVISPRVFEDGELVGYNGFAPASGLAFPLVKLRDRVEGSDWFTVGNLKYAFSKAGLERANRILSSSADAINGNSLIFVDEFGRLERKRTGIYPGALAVAEALRRGGVAVFACRTELVEAVEKLIHGRAQEVFRYEPGDAEALWLKVRRCLSRDV